MILKPLAPLPPTSKDMKMMTVLCISFDSQVLLVLMFVNTFAQNMVCLAILDVF